uniref:WD repeat-containing protein WRAP73 n=1 Tax=Ciona intestinalis TaxID=7719 RepID=A0A1W3JJK5_CIOIN|nr:WD repeat-containing protein WRAP73 [Ciona intestinalis]|eukprot:XP_002131694.1 WD repeat-containing protein WRAP73 [Ciona intestinalis]
MNFSELFKQTQSLVRFSPDGNYLANCVSYKVIIRAVDTLQILRLYTCMDAVQSLEWSSDSQFLLCAMYKRGLVQIWSVEQPDWTCKIDEGSAGLIHAQWSPDGRHVLTTASFNLRITVWSLVNKSISYIRFIKNSKDCLSFSASGKYLAVGECRKCKDYISIFDVESWQLLKLFETDTEDLSGIKWSPDSRVICAWEHCLWYKILIYTMDGRCLSTFKAYDWALGVKRVEWSPASQFLAVGSYDQKVRVLNYITWKSISEFGHSSHVQGDSVVVFKEVNAAAAINAIMESTKKPTELFASQSKYEFCETPVELPVTKPDPQKPNPKIGVSWMAFSPDNRYLATMDDSMKSALHIWTMKSLSLYVVIQQVDPIKCARWNPCTCRLAFSCGNNKVYLWSPSGAVSVQVPLSPLFHVHSLRWHPDGKSLVLASKEQMCVCYLQSSEKEKLTD